MIGSRRLEQASANVEVASSLVAWSMWHSGGKTIDVALLPWQTNFFSSSSLSLFFYNWLHCSERLICFVCLDGITRRFISEEQKGSEEPQQSWILSHLLSSNLCYSNKPSSILLLHLSLSIHLVWTKKEKGANSERVRQLKVFFAGRVGPTPFKLVHFQPPWKILLGPFQLLLPLASGDMLPTATSVLSTLPYPASRRPGAQGMSGEYWSGLSVCLSDSAGT